jgi:predicted ATPase
VSVFEAVVGVVIVTLAAVIVGYAAWSRAGGRARGEADGGAPAAPPTTPPAAAPAPERRRPSAATAIRTPDQRVRIFVSSTLHELAAERAVARRAIESLRLTPVMFELGARPHPPRDLYRAYLAQSDVFVAIYAQRYGWVAPGETVSGLEDEYVLSAGMPKLVYVREGGGDREPRLERLLERVRGDDQASYKSFRTPEDLAEGLTDDLALLLSERFGREQGGRRDHEGSTPIAPLPVPLTSFVGRSDLLDTLAAVLQRPDVRLLTLYGPGGAGKTRVAIELAARVAHLFEDRVSYVGLATVHQPDLVATTLAIALGVKETAGSTPDEAVQRALADRRGLLVIDNFEHLVDAAPVVADLMQAAPGLKVLVTSRSVLRLSGEVVYPIAPLALPAPAAAVTAETARASSAVQLFVERVQAVDPRFELRDDNAAAVVEICRRVDALPLAIELAAARTRSLDPAALLARMTKRLPLLGGGPRDAPERHRTLRAAIDWSVALLTPSERSLLTRLSVFEGGATIGTIERVLADHGDVLSDLSSLVDGSLVQRLGGREDDRVVMLETVREYAAERFAGDPAASALRDRHARAFLAIAEQGAVELRGPDQAQWQRWLRSDLGNLRAAMATFLERGASTEALRLATSLRPAFLASGHYAEGRRLLELALAAAPEQGGPVRGAALLALGVLSWRQGDIRAAAPPAEESLALCRASGDGRGTAAALRLLGVIAHNAGEYDLAQERLEEARALMREVADDEGYRNTLLSLGNVALDRGEARARALYQESRDDARGAGDLLGLAYALDNLGVLAWCEGDLDGSQRCTDEAADLYEQLDHGFGIASVAHRRGLLALARGQLAAAEEHLLHGLRVREEIGDARGGAFVLHDLGRVALEAGRPDEARERFARGIEQAERHGSPLIMVLYLEATSAWLVATGAPAPATELMAAATAWRERQRVPGCRVNRERHLRLLRELERRLDGATRRDAEQRAAASSVPESLALARRLLDRPAGRR